MKSEDVQLKHKVKELKRTRNTVYTSTVIHWNLRSRFTPWIVNWEPSFTWVRGTKLLRVRLCISLVFIRNTDYRGRVQNPLSDIVGYSLFQKSIKVGVVGSGVHKGRLLRSIAPHLCRNGRHCEDLRTGCLEHSYYVSTRRITTPISLFTQKSTKVTTRL